MIRFLKPTDIEFGEVLCLGQRLLARIRSIGIYAERHGRSMASLAAALDQIRPRVRDQSSF